MKTERSTLVLKVAVLSFLFLLAPHGAAAQAPPPAGACQQAPTPKPTPTPQQSDAAQPAPTPPPAGGIRILLQDENKKPVAGRRFFLVRRSAFGSGLDWAKMPRRSDYLRGASPKLVELLAKYDCDSLYCPEIEGELPEAVKNVDEFREAYEAGLKKYRGNERLALGWLTVNLPPKVRAARSDYFRQKRGWLQAAAAKTGKVFSLVTDERGMAFFPAFQKGAGEGDYYISNLLPFNEGGPVWDCKVTALPENPRALFSVSYTLTPPPAQSAAPKP